MGSVVRDRTGSEFRKQVAGITGSSYQEVCGPLPSGVAGSRRPGPAWEDLCLQLCCPRGTSLRPVGTASAAGVTTALCSGGLTALDSRGRGKEAVPVSKTAVQSRWGHSGLQALSAAQCDAQVTPVTPALKAEAGRSQVGGHWAAEPEILP